MATLQEISAKCDQLQAELDEEQRQVNALLAQKDKAIADLEALVKQLQDQIAAGGGASEAEMQEIINKLDATIADLQSTVTQDVIHHDQKKK